MSAVFAAADTSVGQARDFVRGVLTSWDVDCVDEAVLLTSEVVTNAVLHAGTDTEVVVSRIGAAVRVDVVDRYPARWLPSPPDAADQDAEGGRGLLLTAEIATSWGVEYGPSTKRVWFRLGPDDPPGLVGVPSPPPAPRRRAAPEPVPDLELPSVASMVRLELDELLGRAVEWARESTGADGGFVLLATDAERELELRAATGIGPHLPRAARLPAAEGVAGRLAPGLMPEVHADLAAAPPGGSAGTDWLRAAGVRSLLTVPLLAGGRPVGTLGVTAVAPGRFDNDAGARLQRAADVLAVPVQSARLAEIERDRRGWLSFLAEASDLLAGTLELDMTLALVAQLVVPRLGPWAGLYLLDEAGAAQPVYSWHADEDLLADLQQVLGKVTPPEAAPDSVARLWDLADGLDLTHHPALARLTTHGAVTVPLVARGRVVGSLVMGRAGGDPPRLEVLELASDLARRAALALDNARLYEERRAISMALQRSLLPPDLPTLPGVDVGMAYQAAGSANEVGGDFYDVFPLDRAGESGGFAVAVGDVCGKGPEAAAVTGLARHALRLLARHGDDVTSVLTQLNAAIIDEGDRSRFVTVLYGEGAPGPDGGVHLRLASAGHPLPFRMGRDGTVEQVGGCGDLLGIFEEVEVVVFTVDLAPGEALVCFTDGVTERRDGARMLAEDGVRAVLSGAVGLTAPAVARRLKQAVADYASEPPRDDLAVLVVRAGDAVRPRPPAG